MSTYSKYPQRPEEAIYVATDYKIIYEDEHILAVDKPSPLPVHAVGRFTRKNLLSLLQERTDLSGCELSIINRLDSETSGLVLVAKSKEAASAFGKLLMQKKLHKEYVAIVFGCIENKSGVIDTPLGVQLKRDVHYATVPDEKGRLALTRYTLLESRSDYSYVRLIPETGRTHQLRVHMASLGHPIVGDKLYIDDRVFERYLQVGWQEDMLAIVGAARLLLHATRLCLEHPLTQKELVLECATPEAMLDYWNNLD